MVHDTLPSYDLYVYEVSTNYFSLRRLLSRYNVKMRWKGRKYPFIHSFIHSNYFYFFKSYASRGTKP